CTISIPAPRCGAIAERARPVNRAPAAPRRTRPKGIAPSTAPVATTRNSVRSGLPWRASITANLSRARGRHRVGGRGARAPLCGPLPTIVPAPSTDAAELCEVTAPAGAGLEDRPTGRGAQARRGEPEGCGARGGLAAPRTALATPGPSPPAHTWVRTLTCN